ncbi:MAG TPA: polyphosphate polymerase domain-containing protein [Thermoclostridium sp.]
MAYQAVFMRYELKYLINPSQKEKFLKAMEQHMAPDKYGRATIRNIYYDTDSYRLIRRSIESPCYKEKLRVRSYAKVSPESPVFVELKKKYQSVVYKRRVFLPENEAIKWLAGEEAVSKKTQIANEIDYFLAYYQTLHPVLFLSYEREAYYSLDGGDFRVTFDENILCRQEELSLKANVWGIPILPDGRVLMELKCSGGIPLWMVRVMSEERIFKTSYSKYGTAYQDIIYPKLKETKIYA